MRKKQNKLTIGDKVLEIIHVTRITYDEIFRFRDSSIETVDRLEKELEQRIAEIIKK